MTYFDPHIYCKQNLKDEHKRETEFWKDEFLVVLDNAYDMYRETYCKGDSLTLDDIKFQIVDSYIELAKTCLGDALQDVVVSLIEGYEGDVEKVEKPETFYYMPEDNSEEDE